MVATKSAAKVDNNNAANSDDDVDCDGDEDDKETQDIVRKMIQEIREGGEDVCRRYAEKLDNYKGSIVLTEEEINEQIQSIPKAVSK